MLPESMKYVRIFSWGYRLWKKDIHKSTATNAGRLGYGLWCTAKCIRRIFVKVICGPTTMRTNRLIQPLISVWHLMTFPPHLTVSRKKDNAVYIKLARLFTPLCSIVFFRLRRSHDVRYFPQSVRDTSGRRWRILRRLMKTATAAARVEAARAIGGTGAVSPLRMQ
jgi:hypothetical protein